MLRDDKELVNLGKVKIPFLNWIPFDIDVDSSLCRSGNFHFNIN